MSANGLPAWLEGDMQFMPTIDREHTFVPLDPESKSDSPEVSIAKRSIKQAAIQTIEDIEKIDKPFCRRVSESIALQVMQYDPRHQIFDPLKCFGNSGDYYLTSDKPEIAKRMIEICELPDDVKILEKALADSGLEKVCIIEYVYVRRGEGKKTYVFDHAPVRFRGQKQPENKTIYLHNIDGETNKYPKRNESHFNYSLEAVDGHIYRCIKPILLAKAIGNYPEEGKYMVVAELQKEKGRFNRCSGITCHFSVNTRPANLSMSPYTRLEGSNFFRFRLIGDDESPDKSLLDEKENHPPMFEENVERYRESTATEPGIHNDTFYPQFTDIEFMGADYLRPKVYKNFYTLDIERIKQILHKDYAGEFEMKFLRLLVAKYLELRQEMQDLQSGKLEKMSDATVALLYAKRQSLIQHRIKVYSNPPYHLTNSHSDEEIAAGLAQAKSMDQKLKQIITTPELAIEKLAKVLVGIRENMLDKKKDIVYSRSSADSSTWRDKRFYGYSREDFVEFLQAIGEEVGENPEQTVEMQVDEILQGIDDLVDQQV